MRRGSRGGFPAALAMVALLSGCAAGNAYRRGQGEAKKGNWDLAVAKFTVALQKDPENIAYKIALEKARVEASRSHYAEAKKHIAADDLEKAADELDIASKYDPGNKSASDDLDLVRAKIQRREDEKRRLADYEKMKERARARMPVPTLSPRSPVPITLRFGAGTKLQKVLDTLGKLAGVNILYDEGFRGEKDVEVNLTGVTFQEALDQITFTNRLFYKVLNQNTLIIVPESPQKRRTYEDAVLRTFYLQNAETTEVVNLVKQMAQIQKVLDNKALGTITMVSTPDKIAMAERIIDALDKSKGEVIVEVQILEVNRKRLKNYGIQLANADAHALGLQFSPTGAAGEISGGFTNVRAHLLSSLNLADWVVSVPSQIFARFLQTDSTARILASPRLRAAEGKKTTLKIGEEIPIPVTSFTTPQAGQTSFGNATSFQYRNVGINLELTPRINASGDITLDPMTAEFSILGTKQDVGGGLQIPSVITRNVTGTLRLRDGETNLIGGLVQGNDTRTYTGVLGVDKVPLLNRLFGGNSKDTSDTEILISITPHIVRAPKIREEDLEALVVGTEEVVRVEGARPPLFGEPEPETKEPTDVIPTPPSNTTAPAQPPPAATPAGPPGATAPPQETTGEPAAPPRPQSSVTPTVPTAPLQASPAVPGAAPAAPPEGPVTALFSPPEVGLNVSASGMLALVVVGAQDVRSVDVSLAYDTRLIQAVDAAPGSLLTLDGSSVSSQKALEGGRVRLRFTRPSGASGSGVIAAVTFRGMAPGTAAVSVETLSLTTGTGSRLVAAPAPGRIVVTR